MQKILQKYLYGLIGTVILVLILISSMKMMQSSTISFYVNTDGISRKIAVYDAGDGENYVFLPSYAKLEDISVELPGRMEAVLGSIQLKNEMTCEIFELNRAYDFSVSNTIPQRLTFLKSSNVAAMYIDMPNESMEQVHDSKDNVEYADIALVTEEGTLNYSGEGCGIKGRGNMTWQYDKKPYVLTLQNDADLLGMGTSSKWVLLANAVDESNLHNKLVLDFAGRMMETWVPESVYVDLYLNGNYNGLYLLCEKPEIGEGRLELETDAGDFLCRVEMKSRWGTLKNPVRSSLGRAIEISEPDIYSEEQHQGIEEQINLMEAVLSSGMDLFQEKTADERSWIDRYLIDEIFANIDSDHCSSYFYNKDGIFYAGPVWDYDMTMGNGARNMNADAFIAKNLYRTIYDQSFYYDALYRNPFYYSRMVQVYETRYLPALRDLLDVEISRLSMQIKDASYMNSLRWKEMYQHIVTYDSIYKTTADSIRSYLQERINFLNQAWIEGETFCTVQYLQEGKDGYTSLSVRPGTVLTRQMLGVSEAQWESLNKRATVDLSKPVMQDTLLDRFEGYEIDIDSNGSEVISNRESTFATQDYIAFASVALMAVILAFLTVVSFRNHFRERRKARGYSGTKISP